MSGGLKVGTRYCHLLYQQMGRHTLAGELQAHVALLSPKVHSRVHTNVGPSPPFALCQVVVLCVGPGWTAIVLVRIVLELVSSGTVVRAWAGRPLPHSKLCQLVSIDAL